MQWIYNNTCHNIFSKNIPASFIEMLLLQFLFFITRPAIFYLRKFLQAHLTQFFFIRLLLYNRLCVL